MPAFHKALPGLTHYVLSPLRLRDLASLLDNLIQDVGISARPTGATSMALHDHPTFDWVQLPEGRARFSGLVRGIMDEQGHETFAVEVDGEEYFGEVKNVFLPNGNDYNIEVVSFGYGRGGDIGMPMQGRTCRVFTATQASTIQALTVQLIAAGIQFSDRPSLLTEYPNAHFMGQVSFRNGWALVTDDEATSRSQSSTHFLKFHRDGRSYHGVVE